MIQNDCYVFHKLLIVQRRSFVCAAETRQRYRRLRYGAARVAAAQNMLPADV